MIDMAKAFSKRPSEIIGEYDPYTAYCIDEIAMILTGMAIDKDGRVDWDKIYNRNNNDFMDFLSQNGGEK